MVLDVVIQLLKSFIQGVHDNSLSGNLKRDPRASWLRFHECGPHGQIQLVQQRVWSPPFSVPEKIESQTSPVVVLAATLLVLLDTGLGFQWALFADAFMVSQFFGAFRFHAAFTDPRSSHDASVVFLGLANPSTLTNSVARALGFGVVPHCL